MVTGTIRLDGNPADPLRYFLSPDDTRTIGTNRIARPIHIVGTNGGLSEVIVYVKKGLEGLQFAIPVEPMVMRVEDFSFKPRILALMANQKLVYRPGNFGEIMFWTKAKLGLFAVDLRSGEKFRFFAPPELFIEHLAVGRDWMKAHVCAFDHPYFAVTDQNGRFRFPAPLPPGKFTIAARHLHSNEVTEEVEVMADGALPIDLKFSLVPRKPPSARPTQPPFRNVVKPDPVPAPDNRIVGVEPIRRYLHELRLPAIDLNQCALAKALELLDAIMIKTDPDKRVIPLSLSLHNLPPPEAPTLAEVKIKLQQTRDQATGIEVLNSIQTNAAIPIAYRISDAGITFLFRASDNGPASIKNLANLDATRLKELRRELAAQLSASRQRRSAHDPVVMRYKQQLGRVDAELHSLLPKPPAEFTNRLYRTSGRTFASNIMGLAPTAEEVRMSNPDWVRSTYDSTSVNTRRFHWSIHDSLQKFGVLFESPQIRIAFDHKTKKLFVRSRTEDEKIIEYWTQSLEGRAQQVLLESVWVKMPLPDKAPAPSLAGRVSGVLSAESLADLIRPVMPPLRQDRGAADGVIGIATPYQSRLLLGVITNTSGAVVTRTRRLVTVTMRKGKVSNLVSQPVTHPASAATATGRTSNGSLYRTTTINIGPTLDVMPLVNSQRSSIWVKLNANVQSFAGYADPKTTNPTGDRKLLRPLLRAAKLEGNLAVADGHTILLGGVLSNYTIGENGKTSVPNNLRLKRTTIFRSKKELGRRQMILFVTPTLIDSFGDPINSR